MRRDDGVDLVGVQFWKIEIFTGFGLLGSTGCGEFFFLGGNLGSSRTGNSFKIQDGILSKEDHQQRVAIINHMT